MRPEHFIDRVRHFRCNHEWCERKGYWLPESEFYALANPASLCGRTSWCKRCMNRHRALNRRIYDLSRQRRRIETVVRAIRLEVA